MNKKFLLVATLLACAYPFVSHADAAVGEVQQVQAFQAENSRTIHVETAGTLSTLISEDELRQISELKLTGTINSADTEFLQGAVAESENLRLLDFGEATYPANEKFRLYMYIPCLNEIILPSGCTEVDTHGLPYGSQNISISIPESVTFIGMYNQIDAYKKIRFANLKSMLDIVILDYSSVGHSYFLGDSDEAVKDIVLSAPPQTGWLFRNCSDIEDVTIESADIMSFPSFCNCSNLKNVVIGENVTEIPGFVFENCSNLKNVVIGENVSEIYEYAFVNCSTIESITLPKGVESIRSNVFEGCSNLKEIIGENVRTIEENAFLYCLSLESISLPNVERIGSNTFEGCSKLKNVAIGENVSEIHDYAFKNCSSIESISLPNVERIGSNAFEGCSKLKNVVIGENVFEIQDYAFKNCSSIESPISLPNVKRIGNNAFEGCTNLKEINFPNVERIGSNALKDCAKIDILEFESTIAPQIGENAIPEQAIVIVPKEAYADYIAISSLQYHVVHGQIISDRTALFCIVDVKAMNNSSSILNAMAEKGMASVYDLTLKGSINSYDIMMIRNKMPNLKHLDLTDVEIVANPYEYYEGCHTEDHRLGHYAFAGMTNLRSIKLPKTITYIDTHAFDGCSNLNKVVIPLGPIGIDDYAFTNCSSIQKIEIPTSVKTIGNYAFMGCSELTQLSLSEGLLTIGLEAFRNSGIISLTLPSSLESLGAEAFWECRNLRDVYLSTKLSKIEHHTFYNCKSLKSIHIPPMVDFIGSEAFGDTPNLSDVYVYVVNPKDLPIKQDAFSTWRTATLHVPSFGYADYYMNPQWGQFAHLEKFDEPYETFYTKNTLTLDSNTGIIDGTPDAQFYEHGSLVVNDNEVQPLDVVTLVHDGKDGASLIPEQTGNITVETLGIDINVRANSWHFFSFPFDIDLAYIKYDGDYIWRQYDGAKRSRREGGWQNLAAGTTVLKAGRGYIFQGTTAGVLHLEVSHPEITAENVNTELKTYATADTDPADASWNFIGNPYTSYYAVDEATYAAPITIWTGNGYEAYRPGDDDYEFAPYEAFFVQTPTGTNALNFNADNREGYEEMQAAQSQRRMARAQKKVNPNRLLVNLELGVQGDPSTGSGTSEYLDKTRVVFNDECSLDYESDCDAAKFFSDERRAELYTIGTDGTQYAINERPEDGGYVDLGFVANQKGKYTISAQRMDVPMLLIDDVMETTFDLRNGAYEFSSAKGTFNKRFSLKRYEGITTSIKELADQIGITFCISDGSISVEGLDASTHVSLYNTAGQQIATQQGNGTLTKQRQPASGPGTYVISVGKLAAKVIVK